MAARANVIHELAFEVPLRPDGFVRVGVDGVDGAGKTIFADALAVELRGAGRTVVRVCADDFLNARAVRYRQGRDSHLGFFEDSYDYDRLRADVLEPFGHNGSGRYRSVAYDLVTDQELQPPWLQAKSGSVLVLDGLFLHRDELSGVWDWSVFLDVPFEVTYARMASRDGSHPDPGHPSMRRYVEGQRIYLTRCRPWQRADAVIDNSDPGSPRLSARHDHRAL